MLERLHLLLGNVAGRILGLLEAHAARWDDLPEFEPVTSAMCDDAQIEWWTWEEESEDLKAEFFAALNALPLEDRPSEAAAALSDLDCTLGQMPDGWAAA